MADKKELIEEHKRLINVLKNGSRKELDEEAKLQQSELDELLDGKKYTPAKPENKDLSELLEMLKNIRSQIDEKIKNNK